MALLLLPPEALRVHRTSAENAVLLGAISDVYDVYSSSFAVPRKSLDGSSVSPLREGARRSDMSGFNVVGEKFHASFEVGSMIGEGGFGKVYSARHKVLDIARAVKRIKKDDSTREMRGNELTAMQALDHPHIVKLVGFYDEDTFLYLVFELCEGPDLHDHINQQDNGRMHEYEATVALRHMLKALQCCHSQHRGHYDIKPENFMYSDATCYNLKMIDLGLSNRFDGKRNLKISGTESYMAPEFWRGVYGPEGDVWSCGVVLFVMLTGEDCLGKEISLKSFRREVEVREPLKKRIAEAATKYCLSDHAVDLLTLMLQHDRHARPTVRECLKHSFTQDSYSLEKNQPWRRQCPFMKDATAICQRLPETLRAVGKEPMLKRVARLWLAYAGAVCKASARAFQLLDKHGYGEISIGVLEQWFTTRDMDIPHDIEELFDVADLNRDGYVGSLAFLSVTLSASVLGDEELCGVAFAMLDRGKDGFIDATDLESVFGHNAHEVCEDVIAGGSDDGRVCLEQFVQLMRTS